MIETNLIQLPIGTDRRGLHLKPPHGVLIADGVKTQIAKARPFDLSGPWILVSGGLAYGTMEVGLPEPLGVGEFDRRFGEHRVSTSERKKWWTGKDTLYLSPITSFEPFEKTAPIHVVPGMQTVVETVGFKGAEPDLAEHCERVRLVIEARPEVNMEPEEKAIGVELPDTAEEVGETVEEPVEAAALPQQIDDALIMAAKEENPMPYDPKKPPKKIEGMPAKAQRIWVHAYNSAAEKYPDDTARCHKIAYGAVKNAGYYQDDEGNWSKKELGEGVGVGGPRQGVGGTETCVCPACGHKMEHERGTPCAETECPKCGAAMQGQAEKQGEVVMAKEPKVMLKPRDDKAFNVDDYTNRIRRAWEALRPTPMPQREVAAYSWITEVWDEFVIVEVDNIYYRVSYYETGDDEFVFAGRSEWQKVEKETAWLDSKAESKGVLAWLKEKFDGILGDLRGPKLGITFKALDGRTWLFTWTTNAFEDSDEEIFRTKAIEEYVARHEEDDVKGEFWFWHLPGAKMGEKRWQAVVGRFLVEAGPFDDTPIGRKMAEFFSQHPHDHPEIAPEGWGTSHGYCYVDGDRKDKIYDWFDTFETTVLPKSAASNQHSPRMEVLPMNQQQKDALSAIAGDEFVQMIIKTGEERTKELEEQGIAFKEAETEEVAVVEAKPEEDAKETEAQETDEAKETEEVKEAQETEATGEEETDSQTKAISALAQQIVAGLNLGDMTEAIKSVQDTVGTIAASQEEQEKRLKALEDIGGEQTAPLIPLPRAVYWQASRVGPEPEEKMADKAQPQVPDAIVEMAKRIPF